MNLYDEDNPVGTKQPRFRFLDFHTECFILISAIAKLTTSLRQFPGCLKREIAILQEIIFGKQSLISEDFREAIAPLLRLAQLWQDFQQVLLSVDRLGDILNVDPEETADTGLVLPPLRGQITFDQIFFRYQPYLEPALKGISVDVQSGMFIDYPSILTTQASRSCPGLRKRRVD